MTRTIMTSERYSKSAMLLHWLIAAALAFQLGLGELLEHAPRAARLDIVMFHATVGITILLLTLVRVGVRLAKPKPADLNDAGWAHLLARLTHFALYAFMILAPLSGWLIMSTNRLVLPMSFWGLFDWPAFPLVSGLAEATRESLHDLGETVHGALGKIGLVLFLLHVAGALRHQFIKRQPLIERMLPLSRPLGPVAGTVLILLLASTAAALLFFGKEGATVPRAEQRVYDMLPAPSPSPEAN